MVVTRQPEDLAVPVLGSLSSGNDTGCVAGTVSSISISTERLSCHRKRK
jgi:hypothetical protein